jgi:hypothetical protein
MAGLADLLQNPNFLQLLGQAGSTLGRGGSVGEALDPSQIIQNVQGQNSTDQLLRQLLGGGNPQNAASTQMPVNLQQTLGGGQVPQQNAQPYQQQQTSNPGLQNIMDTFKGVTPVGQDGIDGLTTSVSPTGTTTTIKNSPNVQKFGTNQPAEMQTNSTQTGGHSVPFLKALLG